jgi:hypothetical protein
VNKHTTTIVLVSFLLTTSLLATSWGKVKQDQERVQLEKEIKELNDKLDSELQAIKPDDKSTNDPDALDDMDKDKALVRGMEIAQLGKWLKQQKANNQGLAEIVKDAEAKRKIFVEIIPKNLMSLQEAKNNLKLEEIIPLKTRSERKSETLPNLKSSQSTS